MRPRKALGQNFLVDPSVPPRIAAAAALAPGDLVVEVGPGLGVLTAALAAELDPTAGGRLLAVELDRNLLPPLQARFAATPAVQLINADILDLSLPELVGSRPYHVVANLPYYITSAILRHFLEADPPPTRLVVMVQREVAERIVATPPAMSLLAASVQFYGLPRLMFRVPPGAFHPVPTVESAVLRIDVYPPNERPVVVPDVAAFFAIVRAGFGQRRKQLGNSLAAGLNLDKATIAAALTTADLDPSRRAETLTMAEWGALAKVLGEGRAIVEASSSP